MNIKALVEEYHDATYERRNEILTILDPMYDIVGKTFHYLTVYSYNNPNYTVQCKCGTIKSMTRRNIFRTKSCGCHRRPLHPGMVVNGFTILGKSDNKWAVEKDGQTYLKTFEEIYVLL